MECGTHWVSENQVSEVHFLFLNTGPYQLYEAYPTVKYIKVAPYHYRHILSAHNLLCQHDHFEKIKQVFQ